MQEFFYFFTTFYVFSIIYLTLSLKMFANVLLFDIIIIDNMRKAVLINVIFNVLAKALPFVCKNDSRARELFFSLPKNLKVSMGIYGEGPYILLSKTEKQIVKEKDASGGANLEVVFKTRKAAQMVLLGQISVSKSFARHDILLKGDINTAVRLVRIIDIVEYYLFPRFITYKFLPKIQKEFSSFKVYGSLVFLSAKKCVIEKERKNKTEMKGKKIETAENAQKSKETKVKTEEKAQNKVKIDKKPTKNAQNEQ